MISRCTRPVRLSSRGRGESGSDRGETLIELTGTVMLMGFAVVTVLGLIFTMVKITGMHRGTTTANTWVHNIGESVISPTATPYAHCAASYAIPAVPSGYDAEVITVERLSDPMSSSPSWSAMGPGCIDDGGVQRVTLEAWSLGNPSQRERLRVVKRDTQCVTAEGTPDTLFDC